MRIEGKGVIRTFMILAAITCLQSNAPAQAQDDNAPQSAAAVAAIKKHDIGLAAAHQTYLRAVIKLDQQEVADLDAALQAALKKGSSGFEEAKRIETAKKAAQETLGNHLAELSGKPNDAAGKVAQSGFTPTGAATTNSRGELVIARGATGGAISKAVFKFPIKVVVELSFPTDAEHEIEINVLDKGDGTVASEKNRLRIRAQRGTGFNTGASVNIFGAGYGIADKMPAFKPNQVYKLTLSIDKDRMCSIDIDGQVLASGVVPPDINPEGHVTILGGIVSSVVYKRITITD